MSDKFATLSKVMDTKLSHSLSDGQFELVIGEQIIPVSAELSTVSDVYDGAGNAGSRLRADDPVLTLLASQIPDADVYRDINVEINELLYAVADYHLDDGWLTLLLARQPNAIHSPPNDRRVM